MINYKPVLLGFVVLLLSCSNNPYPEADTLQKTLYSTFSMRPKYLDPAKSYSSNEWLFIQSIYETPLQYHYLKRPYQLEENLLAKMPTISQDKNKTTYHLEIKKGIYYQDHPAFVPSNHHLSSKQLTDIHQLSDIKETATRELIASDFVYQIKRLANPKINSPIYGLMSQYIVGLSDFNKQLKRVISNGLPVDLNLFDIDGVRAVDRYRYEIDVIGSQAQFLYWLAMPFFTAMPPEADAFYRQAGLIDKNIILDWYPIGTGAFVLSVNNPNKEMVLTRNKNFHPEFYPKTGAAGDDKKGLLKDAGKALPFLDTVHFVLEKEQTSIWHKFLQGYYDNSGISSDNFDQAIDVSHERGQHLSSALADKDIRLLTSARTSVFYKAFNMLDPIVGGYTDPQRFLRQAIAIAINEEEYITIFANGRGKPAHGPIPSGIFGYESGAINPVVYDEVNGKAQRKSLAVAKELLTKAGYDNGIDPRTEKPLILYFDTSATGVDANSRLSWLTKQLKKLNIELVIRATSYNRFQEKLRRGQVQLFELGWNADYPDPENFLFLFRSKGGVVNFQGENSSNYANQRYDDLFEQMKNMANSDERQAIINEMLEILRQDSPWIWGFVPRGFGLYHHWLTNVKPNTIGRNVLKYWRLDPEKRHIYQKQYNQISKAPLWWFFVMIVFVLLVIAYRRYAKSKLAR